MNEETIASLIRISAHIALRDWIALDKEITDYLDNDRDSLLLDEALLMSYLFLGFPAMMTAFEILMEHDNRQTCFKIDQRKNWSCWEKRGIRLYKKIYGRNADKLFAKVNRMHPEVANWMLVEGYGKVLSRSHLDIRIREYIIITILIISGWPKQLHSHLKGALHAGAASQDIENIFIILQELSIDAKKLDDGLKIWRLLRKK